MKQFALVMVMLCCATLLKVASSQAQTIATFTTSVGTMEVELFDDKPETTANFVKYVASGAYRNSFFHRWVPNFVVQGGGFRVGTNTTGGNFVENVPASPAITNEYFVGRRVSNLYGTIAMAKQGGDPNSATSQWFFNLGNNSTNLDNQNGGFTVFGKVVSGTNVLDKFIPPPPANGIYRVNAGGALNELPVLSTQARYSDLIYVDIKLKRDFGTRVATLRGGNRQISFQSVPGKTHVVEVTTNMPPVWKNVTNLVAAGTNSVAINWNSRQPLELYRIRLDY